MDFMAGLLEATVRIAVPLALAALGGIFAERSGVFNIGLEGMMLAGAFFGVAGAVSTGSAWLGLAAALVAGAAFGFILALLSVRLSADQIVVGIMINLLALGVTSIVFRTVYGQQGQTGSAPRLPSLTIPIVSDIPLLGRALFAQDVLTYGSYLVVALATVYLFRMRGGVRLRAAGDEPYALDAAGVNVKNIRTLGVVVSGVLAAMGGAHLTLVQLSFFTDGMTQGRGFIALAAVIFGRWHPVGAFGAALLFASAEALQLRLQAVGANVPYELLGTLPYVLTIAALAGFVGKASPPAFVGRPFVKEGS